MCRRPRAFAVTMALALCAAAAAAQAPPEPQPRTALTQPALSPDGSQIAFSAGSAIWTVPATGGAARILIADDAAASRPVYSPDGRWLAFNSTRSGAGDIYLYEFATGQLRRLTFNDVVSALDGWSADSQWVVFSSSSHNVGGMNDIYRVRASGGTPMIVASERYESEYDAAAAPDGSIAFCAIGEQALAQWWRKGEAHIDQTEIWSVDPATGAYRQLVAGGAKQIWPMWTPSGRELYYMSDRGGNENLWVAGVGAGAAAPHAVTAFTSGRVLWPAIAANGKAIVFERDFGIWRLDLSSRQAAPVAIRLEGAPALPAPRLDTVTNTENLAVSPDGKKLAFTAHGEVFAAGTETGGVAIRLTRTGRLQSELAWAPDSRRLIYVSDRDGVEHLYEYDFTFKECSSAADPCTSGRERALTSGAAADYDPVFSPDGQWLLFQRGPSQLMLLHTADGQMHELAHGYFDRPTPLGGRGHRAAFSPDSKDVAYLEQEAGSLFSNVYIAPVAGGAGRQVTYLANGDNSELAWSPNAKYLLFESTMRTEPARVARVDLAPRPPIYNEDRFASLFEAGPAGGRGTGAGAGDRAGANDRGGAGDRVGGGAPPPAATIVYDNIEQRLSLLPITDASSPRLSPDGKWLAYLSGDGGTEANAGRNILLYSMEERPPAAPGAGGRGAATGPRLLTPSPGNYSDLQFTADGKELYFLDAMKASHVAVPASGAGASGGAPASGAGAGGAAAVRTVAVSASLEVDFSQEKEEIFDQAWSYLRNNYRDPAMNGVNWDEVRTRYAPVVAGARTPTDLRWVLSEMIGEMNSSHSGIMAGTSVPTPPPATGRLGLFFDRGRYETSGQLCVTEVVPLGPAALAGAQVGDCLTAIDGAALEPGANLDQRLDGTIGRRVTVAVQRAGAPVTLSLQPVNAAAVKNLIYLSWVEHNRAEVERLSHGTLGYVHMNDMSQAALDRLYLDLDSSDFGRQGVVIDIRNNNGGFVGAYALDVLTRRPYMSLVPRGFPAVPSRVILGQRALEKPSVLITNQNSLSDAEDFTEGYRVQGLGKVVGEPTAGWMIFVTNVNLIDNSQLRLPNSRVLDHNGQDMEMHPRQVDVEVQNPPGSWAAGHDPQLEAAVRTLMAQVAGTQGGEK